MYTYLEKLKRSLEGKQLCVYPMGIAGKSMLDKLSAVGIEADYFSDKDCKKWGGYIEK